MLIPDPRRTPLPNLISHNGVILYQWEFLRARLDEGEGLPWIAMDIHKLTRPKTRHNTNPFTRSTTRGLSNKPRVACGIIHHTRDHGISE